MAEPIWPGSGSAVSGNTPFGFYDSDASFQADAPKVAIWAARRMGYPLMDIEMQDLQFYACFEESITEYSSQVNQFNIKDNLLHLQGQETGSNVTHKMVSPTMGGNIRIAEQYGVESGQGNVTYHTGSITVNSGSQTYDLNALWADVSSSEYGGGAIEIKRVFHDESPAVTRYFDPYAGSGGGVNNLIDGFGWGDSSPAVQFTMMPVYADLLRIQGIEFNDQIRKSAYSFEIQNNKIRLFPIPTSEYKVFFHYIKKSDRDNPLKADYSGSVDVVSDMSNVPYDNMEYQYINDVGKQWIRKYTLALSKELLGMVRSKYSSIPIPGAEATLDGETLRSEAQAEKEELVTQLREMLDQLSRRALLEADQEESEHLQQKMGKSPLPIYVG
jgi:hypothetical protein